MAFTNAADMLKLWPVDVLGVPMLAMRQIWTAGPVVLAVRG
jgi:hypothetical protein